MISITLAGAPLGKERVRLRRATGHLYTPERTLNYEARLAAAGQEAMAGRPLLDGPLRLDVMAYVAIPVSKSKRWKADAQAGRVRPTGKPDGDNMLKAIADGLNLIVWTDDSRIVDMRVRKFYSVAPRVEIAVQQEHTEGIFG